MRAGSSQRRTRANWPGVPVSAPDRLFSCMAATRLKQKDGPDAAGHLLHVAHFLFGQGAAQQFLLAVGQPFLDDLVAADRVFPNAQRNVRPVGDVIQIDVAACGRPVAAA